MDLDVELQRLGSRANACLECNSSKAIIIFLTNAINNLSKEHHACDASVGSTEQSNIWVSIVLAVIGTFGVVGNVMNLAVLTRRRLNSTLDRLERSSNYGLFALAVSDLLICLVVIPHGFFMDTSHLVEEDQWFILYYKVYGVAFINLFIMVSMWQVVSMAVHRYMVVAYPLQVRVMLSKKQTFLSIAIVYTVSVILSSPHFIILKIDYCYHGFESIKHYELRPLLSFAHYLQVYVQWVWPVLAVFIPAIILLVCNCHLVNDLRHIMRSRKEIISQSQYSMTSIGSTMPSNQVPSPSTIVTLTLVMVVLVVMFFVAPVEVIRYINPYELWGEAGHEIALTLNLLQAVGFASNFILYFAVNSRFRQTIREMFCFTERNQFALVAVL